MSLYEDFAGEARAVLAEYGQAVTRRSYSAGSYDPATGVTQPTTADTTRLGALFDFGSGQARERGTLIETGDKRMLLDATAAVAAQDHFIVGGDEYTIVSIGEVNPGGTRILYDLHLRRA